MVEESGGMMDALEILILGIIMGMAEGIAIGKLIGENLRRSYDDRP